MTDDAKPRGKLRHVYDLEGTGVRDYYDDWAATYEAELAENRYATPDRCAAALAATDVPKDAPILDFACGTGLSGAALARAGFTAIDGIDISERMLAVAEAKGCYRTLTRVPVDAPPPLAPASYAAVAAIGAVGPGAAPVGTIPPLVEALDPGGIFLISLNDKAMEYPEFPEALAAQPLVELSREHGPHLPGIGVQSWVIVLRRA